MGAIATPRLPFLPFLLLLLLLGALGGASGWNQHEKVLLREIQALTLHRGQFTSARRSAPVPQLQCTGGSAGCTAYFPDVVQCHNKGWDGFDVQWECKADLDQAYRFGRIAVSCEGYDYPEDPYVLRGSCGLEYNLELTEHGQRQRRSGGGGGFSYFSGRSQKADMAEPSVGNGLVVIVVLLVLAYGIYKLFLSGPRDPPPPYSDHPDTQWQDQQGFSHPTGPPPPGFKTHFTGAPNSGFGETSGFDHPFSGHQGTRNSGPGFWTGLGTGGVLGYLFGGSHRANPFSNTWANPSCPPPHFNTWNSPPPRPPWDNSSGFAPPNPGTGTRTASGFGGTKRR